MVPTERVGDECVEQLELMEASPWCVESHIQSQCGRPTTPRGSTERLAY